MKQQPFKKINPMLTNWVIKLHQIGYCDDFLTVNGSEIRCLQNGEIFAIKDLRIRLVDSAYDQRSRCYKYIHTIDTSAGHTGLLVCNGIIGLYLTPHE